MEFRRCQTIHRFVSFVLPTTLLLCLYATSTRRAVDTPANCDYSPDYAGCTEIYRAVSKKFASKEPLLAAAVVESIDAPINGSPRSAGWLLRKAMDAVLQRADGQEVRAALTAAINKGMPLWNSGGIKLSTSKLLNPICFILPTLLGYSVCHARPREGQCTPVNCNHHTRQITLVVP